MFDKVGDTLKNNQITMFSNTFPTLRILYGGGGGGIKKFHPGLIAGGKLNSNPYWAGPHCTPNYPKSQLRESRDFEFETIGAHN